MRQIIIVSAMIRIGTILLAVVCIMLCAATAHAQSTLDQIRARGVIRIGTTGDYFPYSFRDLDTNGYRGYDIDLATRLAHDLGVKLDLVRATWPTLTAGLQAGKYDLAASGITVTPERAEVVGFTTAYLKPRFVPVILKRDAAKFKTMADIDQPGVRIVLQQGTATEDAGRRLFHKAQLSTVLDPVVDYTEVLAGHADVTMTDNLYFASSIERQYPRLTIIDEPSNPETETALMAAKGNATLIAWLNGWIADRQKDGFLDKLQHDWFSPDGPGQAAAR